MPVASSYFTPCFSVSVVNFEYAIADWILHGSIRNKLIHH